MPSLTQLTQNRPMVVVVGSVNMDYTIQTEKLPALGETILGRNLHKSGGGKGANAAVAAAHCGAQSALIAALGDDSDAQHLRDELHRQGVDITQCNQLNGVPTGAAFITVDAQGDNTIVVAAGANALLSFDQVFCALDFLQKQYKQSTSVNVAEKLCLLLSAEIPYDTILSSLDYAYKNQIITIVNPAPMTEELITRLRKKIWPGVILTPNETETLAMAAALDISVETVTDITSLQTIAQKLAQSLHVSMIITLGATGALVVTELGEVTHIPALKVEAIDTVGAGDTFNGYLATAMSDGYNLLTACSWAMQGASQACTYRGAWPAMEPQLHQD